MLQKDPASYIDLPPVLVSVLKQVVHGKLPLHMSIHGISAPFLQVFILKVLDHLTFNDDTKAIFANVLLDMMNRCQV